MREDVAEHQQAKRLDGQLVRSLNRPQNQRLVRKIQNGIGPAPFHTWEGVYAGDYPAFDVDLERMGFVAARITKGLYLHETGNVLPEGVAVMGGIEPFANAEDPDELEYVARHVLAQDPTIIGDGVFSYRFCLVPGKPEHSQWYFEFFEAVPFLCITVDERELAHPRAEAVIQPPSVIVPKRRLVRF